MNNTPKQNSNSMLDLLLSIILPSIILMKFSTEDYLGATGGLIVALAFPLGWGLFDLIKHRKFNFIALLGLISILLTGGIGLLALDVKWLAIKEAAVPAIIGIAVLLSVFTPYPLVRTLLFNPTVMNIKLVEEKLAQTNNRPVFEERLMKATYFVAGSFAFSAVMNYVLAKAIVTSPAGTQAFNEELGQLTLYSYPVIAVPSMLMTMGILYYLWRSIRDLTGLRLEEVIASK
ncbi:VC0807 family protein [Methylophaga sp. OBS1]|uniref:VC0807 family protein n=1 Tax=Methylophaga sp. OBS1 TaxID=2991933 RepID=UPI00224E082E|nr:VC0807 family protein [Methylophaga sp. OBS1]MCX4192306.1 MFS transporter [Methylophaga sp. OBS1]